MTDQTQKDPVLEGTALGSSKEVSEVELETLIQEAIEESKKRQQADKERAEAIARAVEEKERLVKSAVPSSPSSPFPAPSSSPALTGTPLSKAALNLEPTGEAAAYEKTFKAYKVGDIVKGAVLKVDPSGVLLDIGYKADGLIEPQNLAERSFSDIHQVVKVGDILEVYIENLENKDGYIVLSKKRADYEVSWRIAYDAFKKKTVLEAKVSSVVRGGLVVDCNGIRGFIPASQVAKRPEISLESFVGKTIPIKIIEIDRRQGKVVLSHKMAEGEAVKLEAEKLIHELEVGQVRKGVVTTIKSFGAFVDLGGIEGLVHVTEMAWTKVKHPSEVAKPGQEVEVFVLGVDKLNRKIALGLKQLQPDPWVGAKDLYKVGERVKGKVMRLAKFGAFIELERGLEGLAHISELALVPPSKPEDAVQIDQEVEVKILRVIPEEQKIGLSIREALLDKERHLEEDTHKVTIGDIIQNQIAEGERTLDQSPSS